MINAKRKRDKSWKQTILNKIIPDNIEFNTVTLLSRASSLMIRQNSLLMERLMNPDILLDIQLNRYTTFDFDKSEKLVAIGRQRAKQVLKKYEEEASPQPSPKERG